MTDVVRRLAAIVSADVAGYSRLITRDEVATVRALTQHRETISRLVGRHGGRVVDNPGDNALLEFPSATSAVECAIAIQDAIGAANVAVPSDRRLEFRIGIHLGEVMVEDDRIYGDGVNVAARLEAIAPVGGIVVSKSVHDQVINKVDTRFTDLGPQELKNIREAVRVFAVAAVARRVLLSGGVQGLAEVPLDEARSVLATLKAHRTASDPIVLSHGGQTIAARDWRVLYEFPSALEAVKCAAAVQKLMAGRNASIPAERRMRYQIGIHEDSTSEALEKTVQIQSRGHPGGICISEPIHRQIVGQLPLDMVEIAPLADGTRLWTVPEPDPGSTPDARGGPGAILVLPFQRIGADSEQDYLVEGITEDLITALSEYGEHRVVPRSTAYAFRDPELSDRDVARQSDATYVLRGSVRAAESRVRVSTELVEAESGDLVWSDRIDRDYADILDLQDDIAYSITTRLAAPVRDREVQRSLGRTENLQSWDLMQRGKWHYYRNTKHDFDRAVDLLTESIGADPENGQAYSWLCLALFSRLFHGWGDSVAGDFERIRSLATEALRIDPEDWRAHNLLAAYFMFTTRDFERAIAEAQHGERFELWALGAAYLKAGEHEQAVELLMRDIQSNPDRPDRYHHTTNLAEAHYLLGNYSASLAWAEQTLEINPSYIQAVGYQAASLAQLGRIEEARLAMNRILEQFPGATAADHRKRFNWKFESDVDHYMEGLIKAGMPAGSPDVETVEARRAAWLAVLPFSNIGGDPSQAYFADGITEDVITGLSAYRSLRVIASSSVNRYRGSDLTIPAIAEELGVRFVLEGTVRKADDRVRVTARLIEAPTRNQIWADRYETGLDHIFDAQDRITTSIVAAIDPAIRSDHIARAHPEDLRAWDRVQRGWFEASKAKPETGAMAMKYFEEALELDPEYAQAHAGLSWTLGLRVWLLQSDEPDHDLALAEEHAKRAISLDERDAVGHESLALAAYAMGRMPTAVREADRAIALNPSRATAHMIGGAGRIHGGDPDAGIPMMTRAIELSPHDPALAWFYGGRAIGHLLAGNYAEAVVDAREAITARYGYLMGRVILTVGLVQLGRVDEAHDELHELLAIEPEFNTNYLRRYTFTGEQREMFHSSLRRAGLAS